MVIHSPAALNNLTPHPKAWMGNWECRGNLLSPVPIPNMPSEEKKCLKEGKNREEEHVGDVSKYLKLQLFSCKCNVCVVTCDLFFLQGAAESHGSFSFMTSLKSVTIKNVKHNNHLSNLLKAFFFSFFFFYCHMVLCHSFIYSQSWKGSLI